MEKYTLAPLLKITESPGYKVSKETIDKQANNGDTDDKQPDNWLQKNADSPLECTVSWILCQLGNKLAFSTS